MNCMKTKWRLKRFIVESFLDNFKGRLTTVRLLLVFYGTEMENDPLNRFREPQDLYFKTAFQEIEQGRKSSHWMWFIFPQLAGLGSSEMARRYAIRDLQEAALFLGDASLGSRLVTISRLVAGITGKTAFEIFGSPDDMKLRSSMTLFSLVSGTDPVFRQVLDRYFGGEPDPLTLKLLGRRPD